MDIFRGPLLSLLQGRTWWVPAKEKWRMASVFGDWSIWKNGWSGPEISKTQAQRFRLVLWKLSPDDFSPQRLPVLEDTFQTKAKP